MNPKHKQTLAALVRGERTAALATLHSSEPAVSMILFAASPDFAWFYIHTSTLASHTHDFLDHPQITLMISATDSGQGDPQSLPRVAIIGDVEQIPGGHPDFSAGREIYLAKYPQSEALFAFKDFGLYRFQPRQARFVAGFAQALNLTLDDFLGASGV